MRCHLDVVERGLAVLRTLEISNLQVKDLPGAPQTETE